MIYITGDTHRDFSRFYSFKSKEDDTLIVLGDVGINYYLNEEDKNCKEYLKKLKLKLFCVNPAANIQRFLEYGNSTIYFSATFLPVFSNICF